MTKRHKDRPNHTTSTQGQTKRRSIPRAALIMLAAAAVIVALLGFAGWRWRYSDMSNFQKLTGKWRRPDGGYVVEVRGVDGAGKMDAAYFNPRPIHIARAEASRDETATKVFIELRDVNYPGSTYNLVYEKENDQLQGIYYQALLRQSYEVVFERMR